MKNFTLIILCLFCSIAFATKITINTSFPTFTPSDLTINQGDTIVFTVGGGHTATEVSQTTWNANENTPNGAFDLNPGSNQLVIGLSVGVHYFVCKPHAGMGMKGKITVDLVSGVKNKSVAKTELQLLPNPTKNEISFKTISTISFKKIIIFDLNGKVMKEINATNSTTPISIIDFPNGMYFLSAITNENEVLTNEFVKE
jgi:plastocyanin